MMERLTPDRVPEFPVVVHGTYFRSWPAIRATGLSPMGRQHIHLATGLPDEGGVVSGMRKSSELLIYIDLATAVADGIEFFLSKNRVILTPGDLETGCLPPKYFAKVLEVKTRRDILFDKVDIRGTTASAAPVGEAGSANTQPAGSARAAALSAQERETMWRAAGVSDETARQWKELQESAPSAPKGVPSPETIALLRNHKALVKAFLAELPQEQRNALTSKRSTAVALDPRSSKKIKSDPKSTHASPTLRPMDVKVALGWDKSMHQFTEVIPFYSQTRRSKQEVAEDTARGIDRRVFSNLYPDSAPLRVPALPDGTGGNLMRYDWLAEVDGVCSESFFQSAKCLHECDARFIMADLNELEAAKFGQSRLHLTSAQVARLVELGADRADFKRSNTDPGDSARWLRGKNGYMPRRGDWEEVKPAVMLHIVRTKFGCAEPGTTAHATIAALKLDKRCPLFVEHTRNDKVWADHGTGAGWNLLGKTVTQVILELCGQTPLAPWPKSLDVLRRPNSTIVRYADAPTTAGGAAAAGGAAVAKDKAAGVDYLCVLDFEATCDEKNPPFPQEIIEVPTVLVNARTGKVEAEFHHYVTPDVHPKLTRFCTELTGITQDMVNGKVSLNDALREHRRWRADLDIVPHGSPTAAANPTAKTFLFVTCGDWDLKTCLPTQLKYHGQAVGSEYRSWINIKVAFKHLYGTNPRGMTGMLDHLKMKLQGRHHSGIDDCKYPSALSSQGRPLTA